MRCCCARPTTCAGLPVSVFRCDMIMADTTYAGQLNVPDMFTRMMLSLVATGIAPYSFAVAPSSAARSWGSISQR